jgi:hypothetical protein
MENIRYEVWLQNQDKFVAQCTIVHCVTNSIDHTLDHGRDTISRLVDTETKSIP